jgi:hypothetical protein
MQQGFDMASGSDGGGKKFAAYNARVKVAIAGRTTAAQKRSPQRKAG